MAISRFSRVLSLSGWVCAGALLVPALASAQGELGVVGFQATPYNLVGTSTQTLSIVGSERGPKAQGNLWDFTHFASGGYNNRGFVRYSWWDWDVSRTGHNSEVAGWTAAGGAIRPPSGWTQFGQGPYYVRMRLRINRPILPYPSNGMCDGDTQMKWFIWNSYTGEGTDRAIIMLHDGVRGGGSETGNTTVQLRAGVSGSFAQTVIPNGQWVNLQFAFRWGPESSGYQRIYVNNNNVGSPTVANNRFDDLDVWGQSDHWGHPNGPQGLDQQFFIGDITNTGSCVREDAQIDMADLEIATQFDSAWSGGGAGSTTMPEAPRNLRIVPGDIDQAALPAGVVLLLLSMRFIGRKVE